MATSVRIELNSKGIADFLKSDDVRYDIHKRVTNVADTAGPDYEAVTFVGRDRAQGIARTGSLESRRDNAENHTLLRSLSAGGS